VKFLADVNVLLPLLVSRHTHREVALEWFDGTDVGEVGLCRLARLGVLRLLCTPQVMGPDVLKPHAAVVALEMLEADERISLLHEPEGLDSLLKSLVAGRGPTPNLWTVAYLAAFAKATKMQIITFDRGFSKFTAIDCRILSPDEI
jgi:hypothetical protein